MIRRIPGGGGWLSQAAVQALVSLLGASLLVWALLPLAPGDPARRILEGQGIEDPTPAQIEGLRTELRLDRSIPEQYGSWLGRAVRGDLSTSWTDGSDVRTELLRRAPATALLAVTAIALALAIAVPAALLAARFPGRWPDTATRGVALLGSAVPSFVTSLLLLQVVVVGFGWGSTLTRGTISDVWLPAAALAFALAATWSRLLRASLLEALSQPYTAMVAARGASRTRVLVRHALPNASVPLLHAVGLGVGALLGGAAIVETVFTWPGVGRYVVSAVQRRDLPVVQGFAMMATLVYVTVSLSVDGLSRLIDPRLRAPA